MKIKTILACIGLICFAAPTFAGTCSGGANCRACTTCGYCKHCAREGGTCSVCTPRAAPPAKAIAMKRHKRAAHPKAAPEAVCQVKVKRLE